MSAASGRVGFAADTNIHPSRLGHIAGAAPPEPKKPKEKTVAKKRYLAKKARRHKVLSKAKKASAPKKKDWDPSEASTASVIAPSNVTAPAEVRQNAEAGPSRLATEKKGLPQQISVVDAKGTKRKRKTKEEDLPAAEAEGEIVDEAAERERRKREKREKRAARDHEEKRRRKEEKRKARAVGREPDVDDDRQARAENLVSGDAARQDEVGSDETNDAPDKLPVDIGIEGATDDQDGSRGKEGRPSPPPLTAFPLPTPAAAPDPSLLSRQGLPANLEKATLIDQNLKIGIEEMKAKYADGERGLDENLLKHLRRMGIENFFAVQAAMLPHLLPLPLVPSPFEPLNDYLISAPTGSGKTLAYTIPIINVLKDRQITRLRALIVLPTRDLVVQVRETMEALAKGTGLITGTATGQHTFSHEQSQLVADRETKLLGGSSKVDILIATPGRLIDHLAQTPNFSLQHLRFLVIDEADRLLNQSFQNWLQQVLSHTRPPTERIALPADFKRMPWDLVASEWQVAYGTVDVNSQWYRPPRSTCQKLLFSATLTRDPAAIASLNLRDPQYFIVQDSEMLDPSTLGETFALPSTLTEKYLALPPQLKPLNLIHLLHGSDFAVRGALVFTKSVESVNRLVALLTAFEQEFGAEDKVVVKGYTSEMRPAERKNLLGGFTAGDIHLLVCSDVIARGVDLPTVEHVISYDTPVDIRKYVHRVGRTARAGRAGTAWTLVEKQEALHFKGMMKAAGRDKKVKKIKVKEEDLARYREAYEKAMGRVKDIYVRHEQ